MLRVVQQQQQQHQQQQRQLQEKLQHHHQNEGSNYKRLPQPKRQSSLTMTDGTLLRIILVVAWIVGFLLVKDSLLSSTLTIFSLSSSSSSQLSHYDDHGCSTNTTIYYSHAREDRSGGAIQDMLTCHAYVYSLSNRSNSTTVSAVAADASGAAHAATIKYGGSCGYSNHSQSHRTILRSLGLDTILPMLETCPTSTPKTSTLTASSTTRSSSEVHCDRSRQQHQHKIVILNRSTYYEYDTKLFNNPNWLHYIGEKLNINKHHQSNKQAGIVQQSQQIRKDHYTIVVHIRRGDVSPCLNTRRYLPNVHYKQLIDKAIEEIIEKAATEQVATSSSSSTSSSNSINITIKVYSETPSFESLETDFGPGNSYIFTRKRNQADDSSLITVHVNYELIVNNDDDNDNNDDGIQYQHLASIWNTMIHDANVLVLSKSSFSLVPAILGTAYHHYQEQHQYPNNNNNNEFFFRVMYTEFWHGPLKHTTYWSIHERSRETKNQIKQMRLSSKCNQN